MVLTEYLSSTIKPLKLEGFIENEKDHLENYETNYIPVVDYKNHFIGMVSKSNAIESSNNKSKSIENLLEKFFLLEESSIIDSIKIFEKFQTNLIPVVNQNIEYIGCISLYDLINKFSNFSFFSEYGFVIEIEISVKKYSLSEITQIMEVNNMKILGIIMTHNTEEYINLIIKVQGNNISAMVANLERYGYLVKNKFLNDIKNNQLKNHYQLLMKFLDI